MTDLEIEAFLAVVQYGSLTQAAENLFITQPTLSHRLQMLEKELGGQLIRRQKGMRRAELTEAGRRFVPVAEKWKALWTETQGALAAPHKQNLRISATNSLTTYIMPAVYQRFLDRRLPVSLIVSTLHSHIAYQQVENHELDLGFIANPMYAKRAATVPVFRERMLLITGRAYDGTVHPGELSVENEVLLSWSNEFMLWHEYWFGVGSYPRVTTDNLQITEQFINQPQTWALMPFSAAEAMRARMNVHVTPVGEPPPDRVIYMVYSREEGQQQQHIGLLLEDLKQQLSGRAGIEFF